jgi:hypothetical protein
MQTKSKIHLRGVVMQVNGPTDFGPIIKKIPITAQVTASQILISFYYLDGIVAALAALHAVQVLMSVKLVAFM